jgi:DNA-binding FrmR family transcriptional regulator
MVSPLNYTRQRLDLHDSGKDVPTPPGVGYTVSMKPEHKTSALNRLKTVRGHVDAVIRMVDEEQYCPDIMKQVSALQGSLEGVNRILLQNHVETCVLEHVKSGRSEQVVDELLETLRYAPSLPSTKGSS